MSAGKQNEENRDVFYALRKALMKYKIEKNTVQETLILPLYSRKLCTELYPNLYRAIPLTTCRGGRILAVIR